MGTLLPFIGLKIIKFRMVVLILPLPTLKRVYCLLLFFIILVAKERRAMFTCRNKISSLVCISKVLKIHVCRFCHLCYKNDIIQTSCDYILESEVLSDNDYCYKETKKTMCVELILR